MSCLNGSDSHWFASFAMKLSEKKAAQPVDGLQVRGKRHRRPEGRPCLSPQVTWVTSGAGPLSMKPPGETSGRSKLERAAAALGA